MSKKIKKVRVVTVKSDGELSDETHNPSTKAKLHRTMSAGAIRDLVRRRREEVLGQHPPDSP